MQSKRLRLLLRRHQPLRGMATDDTDRQLPRPASRPLETDRITDTTIATRAEVAMLFSPIRHRGRLYLRSLCVVLTINQPLRGCAAV